MYRIRRHEVIYNATSIFGNRLVFRERKIEKKLTTPSDGATKNANGRIRIRQCASLSAVSPRSSDCGCMPYHCGRQTKNLSPRIRANAGRSQTLAAGRFQGQYRGG